MVIDWLAVGLDPARCTIFVQSAVKEHAELHLLLSHDHAGPWLERNPTYKEQREQLARPRPLDATASSATRCCRRPTSCMYQATAVPVGVDQVPHVELTREIARRFNHLYGDALSRAAGAAHRDAEDPRHRRPQDEQELRQRRLPRRAAGRGRPQALAHDDRPAARAPHRSRRSRRLSGVSTSTASTARRRRSPGRTRAAAPPASAASTARRS